MSRKNRVLVIGNTLADNTIRQFELEEAGYAVVTALGASPAMEAARRGSFDMALLDGYFAVEDVQRVLDTLRSYAIPSILVTPGGTAAELKSMAHRHLHLEDTSWLSQVVSAALRPQPTTKAAEMALGVGKQTVRVGEHLAWLFANDEQFARAVRFLELGFEQGDTAIVYGDSSDNERVGRILSEHGLNERELLKTNRLMLLDAGSIIGLGDAWMHKAKELITSIPSRVRILGCGTLRLPWASDEAFVKYEAQVDSVIHGTRCTTACMYDLNAVSGKNLFFGAFGQHKTVVTPTGVVRGHAFLGENLL
jgi:CheY-like chemotaxis protein